MLVYWVLFLAPAIIALTSPPNAHPTSSAVRAIRLNAAWTLTLISLILIIGFRDRVGGDWFNYFHYLFRAEHLSISEALTRGDPAYEAINVISMRMGLGVVGVNLFCAIVFSVGLVVYVQSMPRPWLALAVAIPYMTVVVSMGYSRQGVALGFALIGLVALGRERFLWFCFWIFIAATFHRSAVLLIGIALLSLNFRKISNLPILLLIAFLMYISFLEDQTDHLVTNYIEAEMQSDGAFVRLLMNVIPAIIFILYRKNFIVSHGERKLYSTMSYLSIAAFFALIAGLVPSTALDRIALYLLPLQVFVFTHLPDSASNSSRRASAISTIILIFYAMVLFVWLNFANFSHWWIPYRMFPPLDVNQAFQMRR